MRSAIFQYGCRIGCGASSIRVAVSVPAVMSAIVAISAIASLTAPANVAKVMTNVGLEAAFLEGAGSFRGDRAAADNADKAAIAATAMAAAPAAARFSANGGEGHQSARHKKSRKRSFDRWAHLYSPNLPQLSIKLSLRQR